ncbi:GAF and ANTAR domain-containing protein [Agromyces humatus]|uniref:GAF and ANTAR domain-containing protein n=1 Tax=Agromyces humatus TaxID=279573 RepID=A0ABP4X6Q0_9MICO|nr:GAF and ANTAR domain-containing protein [Agromyces humatus]
MNDATRESRLVETFVTLADTLVEGYDVIDLLHTLVERCRDLLDAADAGIILADPRGALAVAAATSARSERLGAVQLSIGAGPCIDAYTSGAVVSAADRTEIGDRWPTLAEAASDAGYESVHAIPMRLRDSTIGSLNLFGTSRGRLNDDDALVARALADVATISILHERAVREGDVVRAQLQHALDSRVLIEQAKGIVAQTRGIDVDEAFGLIRQRARDSGTRLVELARGITERVVEP